MRKGQEEIVGFILIIIVVVVVFVIFLGLSLNRQNEGSFKESKDVQQFLESAMEFTTDCSVSFIPDYSAIGELFNECLRGSQCLNEESACESLEKNLGEIIETSWDFGENRPIKAYRFSSVFRTNSTEEKVISFNEGNCTGSVRGAESVRPAFPGRIASSLELCF